MNNNQSKFKSKINKMLDTVGYHLFNLIPIEFNKLHEWKARAAIKRDYHKAMQYVQTSSIDKRNALTVLIQNQYDHIIATAGTLGHSLHKVAMLQLSAEVFDALFDLPFVKIQPMSGPVGVVYTFQYTNRGEDKITKHPHISLEVVADPIEARTLKFKVAWNIELDQSISDASHVDLEQEVRNSLKHELICELYSAILKSITDHASEGKIDLSDTDKAGICINAARNDIAQRSKRGTGNTLLMPHEAFEIIKKNYRFKSNGTSYSELPSIPLLVGTLDDTINVYVSSLVNDVVMGYVGQTPMDGGLIFGPYIPLMSSNVSFNPETFAPCVSLFTRYGMCTKKVPDFFVTLKK